MIGRCDISFRVKKALKASGKKTTQLEALEYVNAVVRVLSEGLAKDGRIELRDIGVWRTKFKPKRIQTFHIWKKKTVYGGYVGIYFKPGKWLQAAVNGGKDYVWSKSKQIPGDKNYGGRYKVRQQEGSEPVPRIEAPLKKWGDTRS